MDTGAGVGVSRLCAFSRVVLCAAAILMMSLGALVLGGCTSEADLVQTLSTEKDGTVRAEAAAELAKRHSLAATEQLVTAAAKDPIAAAGLDALAEAYGDVVNEAAQKAAESEEKSLGEKTSLQLQETLECLSAMGTDKAVEVLIEVGTGLDKAACLNVIRGCAATELGHIGEPAAAPLMKLAADDNTWSRGALKCVGEDAVAPLLDVLGTDKWAEAVLAGIGEPAVELVAAQVRNKDGLVAHRALGVLLRMYDDEESAADKALLTEDMVMVILADLGNKAFEAENAATKTGEGFDHVYTAEDALVDIGEPAAATVLAASYEEKWLVLEMMGADAVPALTAGLTGDSRIGCLYSAMTLVYIGQDSPADVQPLTDAMDNKDLQAVAENYLYYLALGESGSEQVMADALAEHGKIQMATDYVNSGNATLEAAGRKWASRHGYYFSKTKGGGPGLRWGI